jgi:hypothetical protein
MSRKELAEIKLNLKDWKNVELSCINAIEDAKRTIVLNDVMLQEALIRIKELGGLSHAEEIEKEEKAEKTDKGCYPLKPETE